MLTTNFTAIGNRLLAIRKRMGMTQTEVAESAGLSDRTYADIERGTVNMRIDTMLRICKALHITPDQILTEDHSSISVNQEVLIHKLNACNPKDRETALRLLSVFLDSVE